MNAEAADLWQRAVKALATARSLSSTDADAAASRNDPCPCGSGKKFKRCCLGEESAPHAGGPAAEAIAEIEAELEGKRFESLEEANNLMREVSSSPARPDCCGSSGAGSS